MKTVFTFPRKNPQYYNIKELRKTCYYLGLPHQNKNKQELIKLIMPYNLPNRVQIHYNHIFYYVNCQNQSIKSFIKINDDLLTTYKLSFHKSKLSYLCFYDKKTNEWFTNTNFKTKNYKTTIIDQKDLFHLQQGYLFIELIDIYVKYKLLFINNIIIKDIFIHFNTIYKNVCQYHF
jgi:hypothetical protein